MTKIIAISNCTPRDLTCLKPLTEQYPGLTLIRPDYSYINNALTRKQKLTNYYTSKRQGLIQRLIRRQTGVKLGQLRIQNYFKLAHADFFNEIGVNKIKALEPDIIITCNSPILTKDIFSLPKLGAFNIHFGIPPEYRGNHTIFWALYNKDYDKVGASCHKITKGIDRGNIMFNVYPELEPSDTEISLQIKAAKLTAEALLNFIKESPSSAKAEGLKQAVKGKNYNSKERTFIADLNYIFSRREIPYRNEKVERFY